MKYYTLGVALEESKRLQEYFDEQGVKYSIETELTDEQPGMKYKYEERFMLFHRFTVALNECELSALALMFDRIQILPCSRFIAFLNFFRRKT